LFLVTVLPLAACHRADYVYVAFGGANVEVVETGEPPMAYRRFGGEAVPIRYSVSEPDGSLAIVMTNEAFVPSFDILSSVPIRSIEADHMAIAIPRRPCWARTSDQWIKSSRA